MTTSYPDAFAEIRPWATANGVGITEARVRFAQYATLRAIAQSRQLSAALVFKGGNALDFVWQPNRSTRDLDFSADLSDLGRDLTEAAGTLSRLLTPSLLAIATELRITFRLERIEQQPPGADKTFVTYQIRVGYALPDQDNVRRRILAGLPSNQAIKLDVSVNESICADVSVNIGGLLPLRVSTLEDIIAEKLRALLQQPIRNRQRRQDLLDIAVVMTNKLPLNHDQIAAYLLRKAVGRGISVSRAAFDNAEIKERAHVDYSGLATQARVLFIPFDEAWDLLLGLVDALPLPE